LAEPPPDIIEHQGLRRLRTNHCMRFLQRHGTQEAAGRMVGSIIIPEALSREAWSTSTER
jgi:hypothetical protein